MTRLKEKEIYEYHGFKETPCYLCIGIILIAFIALLALPYGMDWIINLTEKSK